MDLYSRKLAKTIWASKHSRETPFKRMYDQMDKTGLPHLDINSFPTVRAALKTELKVLKVLKNKSNQKRQV